TAQDRVQTFLDRTPDRLRRNPVFLVIFHLFATPIFRDRYQRFHALRNLIGKQHDLAIDVPRGAAGSLNQWSLAAQKSFLDGIENANEGDFGKIEPFAEQIDAD